MTRFELLASLLLLAATAGFINYRWLRLPPAIGLLVVSLVISGAILGFDQAFDDPDLRRFAEALVDIADLPQVLLGGGLGFLLFAAAQQIDVGTLRDRRWTVLALATVGVVLSTVFYGLGIWAAFALARAPCRWRGARFDPCPNRSGGGYQHY